MIIDGGATPQNMWIRPRSFKIHMALHGFRWISNWRTGHLDSIWRWICFPAWIYFSNERSRYLVQVAWGKYYRNRSTDVAYVPAKSRWLQTGLPHQSEDAAQIGSVGGMGGFSGPGGWRNDVWIIGSMGDLQDPILDGGSYQKIWPNIWYSTFTYPPLNRILKISHWLMVTWKRTHDGWLFDCDVGWCESIKVYQAWPWTFGLEYPTDLEVCFFPLQATTWGWNQKGHHRFSIGFQGVHGTWNLRKGDPNPQLAEGVFSCWESKLSERSGWSWKTAATEHQRSKHGDRSIVGR